MASPDVVQNAKDSNDWRHQVTNLMQDEDNGDGAGDTASEAFNCGICSKSLKNKESLRKHKKTHTIEPSTCEVCDKQLKSKGLLSKHRKTVHNDVMYSCDSCNKRFTAVKKSQHMSNLFIRTNLRNVLCVKKLLETLT